VEPGILGGSSTCTDEPQRIFGRIEARNLAPLPGDIDFTVGASLPISCLTAWQGLFQHGRLQAGGASSCTARPAPSGRW
jgi:hypothetical protein